jgi:hypothetical protein
MFNFDSTQQLPAMTQTFGQNFSDFKAHSAPQAVFDTLQVFLHNFFICLCLM